MKRIIIEGDAIEELRKLPSRIVHVAITSPPYWGLRDYGTGSWIGGKPECPHLEKVIGAVRNTLGPGGRGLPSTNSAFIGKIRGFKRICRLCGARRIDRQLGLERIPEQYIEKLVGIFREVWRVLRDDGTLWLNLGDCYATGTTIPRKPTSSSSWHRPSSWSSRCGFIRAGTPEGLKTKDLIGIPWRVAFALQADGWYLRQDIIWAKPNPMPESVVDRPTRSHEYIFLFSKSLRYYFDAESISEPLSAGTLKRINQKTIDTQFGGFKQDLYKANFPGKKNRDRKPVEIMRHIRDAKRDGRERRNSRSVWTIATQPFKGAHFATFPSEIVRPCLLAGSPIGGVVLDPFFGSGTVGVVAKEEGRGYIGIDLNPAYCEMALRRIAAAKEKVTGQ